MLQAFLSRTSKIWLGNNVQDAKWGYLREIMHWTENSGGWIHISFYSCIPWKVYPEGTMFWTTDSEVCFSLLPEAEEASAELFWNKQQHEPRSFRMRLFNLTESQQPEGSPDFREISQTKLPFHLRGYLGKDTNLQLYCFGWTKTNQSSEVRGLIQSKIYN